MLQHTQTPLNDICKLNIEMIIWIFTANKWIGGGLKRAECPLARNAHNVSSSAPSRAINHASLPHLFVGCCCFVSGSACSLPNPEVITSFLQIERRSQSSNAFFLCWTSTVGTSVACTLSSSFGAKGVLKDYRWGNLQGGERVAISICCNMRDMVKDPSTQLSAFLLALGTIPKWCSTLNAATSCALWNQAWNAK